MYSALTMSLFANVTCLNQATHCIYAMNLSGSVGLQDTPNQIMFDLFGLCNRDNKQSFPGTSANLTASHTNTTVLRLLD